MLNFVGMGSSTWLERPWAWRMAMETPKEDPPKCWCQDVCKAKQSDDWDETRGRRFWLSNGLVVPELNKIILVLAVLIHKLLISGRA